MKKTTLLLFFLIFSLFVNITNAKDEYVEGYYKKDGTYVKGYYRTIPDGDKTNNYSAKGNVNPHNGKKGTQ